MRIYDCQTSCGLMGDDLRLSLVTDWKFGFVFDPRLHDL